MLRQEELMAYTNVNKKKYLIQPQSQISVLE